MLNRLPIFQDNQGRFCPDAGAIIGRSVFLSGTITATGGYRASAEPLQGRMVSDVDPGTGQLFKCYDLSDSRSGLILSAPSLVSLQFAG